ncbi:uncharacterized protein LOC106883829 [Octopus bimaculoides]|uniref:Uncharacterized protein n=1 Tax=Octopus bimaculoides TaxID=37653 RepID=A0A0L8I6C3_OCTBM|nr:uncharacterized protein LOC106883829 [Octopus bimaculoides]|eukprot:XP_014790454.1 PREDICTED: uncharacterized protein LOC106883829 [Octopus bimaculoides]
MTSIMQFAAIFALLGAIMYLPGFHASALHSSAMKQLIVTDAEPQVAAAAVIEGASTVLDIISKGREFFKNVRTTDFMKTKVIPYHCDLAPSLGKLNVEEFKKMDRRLQTMIGTTKALLEKLIREEGKSNVKFERYQSAMLQNHFAQKMDGGYEYRNKLLQFEFKGISTGREQQNVAIKVDSWFKELLNDSDVYQSTKIELQDFKNIASATGVAVESFATLFYANKKVTRDVVDVGILRYPDPLKPYFKLYRIKLFAYSDRRRYTFYEETYSGIEGTYHSQNFEPRSDVIDAIEPDRFKNFIKSALDSLL